MDTFVFSNKCFQGGVGPRRLGRRARRRRDVYPARPAARAAEPHARRARHRERAQGGEGHRARRCDPPCDFENTLKIL